MNKLILATIIFCGMGACWKQPQNVYVNQIATPVPVQYYNINYYTPIQHTIPQIVWIPVAEVGLGYRLIVVPCIDGGSAYYYGYNVGNGYVPYDTRNNVWIRYNY